MCGITGRNKGVCSLLHVGLHVNHHLMRKLLVFTVATIAAIIGSAIISVGQFIEDTLEDW